MAYQLMLMGSPHLVVDERAAAVAWPRRTLALLTYLFTARRPVARDAAALALWPDDDIEISRANVRRNLNLLRGVLPAAAASWVVADAGTLAFDHAAATTDVAAFEALATSREGFSQAVALYGGDFASPLDEPWILTERERLRTRFHTVLGELASSHFSARRFDDALAAARRIAADEPFREDNVRRIIAIRYAQGDRPGALMEFESFARALHVEFDVAPMPETVALRDLVLRGDALPSAPDASIAAPVAVAAPLLPFGGRDAALAALRSAWDAAGAGRGTAIFVAGEAGIGKTRLVAEFLERVVGSTARIVRGTTASPESRSFEPILNALGQCIPALETLGLERVWIDVLAPLVPGLAARLGHPTAPEPLPPEREVVRLFEALTRCVIALARARPLVLVIEDVHWAGPATLDALRALAARLAGHRVLLVLTQRTGESPAAETLRRQLCASGHAQAVSLSRLTPDETRAILGALVPPLGAAAAQRCIERSEGHPLFLAELVRDGGAGAETAALSEVVAARLAHCSERAQTLARIAAISGPTFDLDLLRAVAGWDDGTLIDALAELLERQFVRATAAHEWGSYTFSHDLVRSAIASATDAAERRCTHRIVARSLESRALPQTYDRAIAAHWAGAGECERAAQAYARAAAAALSNYARDESIQLASEGLALTCDPRLTATLLELRITANLHHTDLQALQADVARLEAAVRDLDDDARYAAAKLRLAVAEIGGEAAARRAAIDALRVLGGETDPLRAAYVAEAEARNAKFEGDLRAALTAADAAMHGYAACGAQRDALRASLFAGWVLGTSGDLVRAEQRFDTAKNQVDALDDPALTMEYWHKRAGIPHSRRDAAGTLVVAEQLFTVAVKAGDRLMEGKAVALRSTAYQHASVLGRALAEVDRAVAIFASIGAHREELVAINNRASLLFQIGRIEESAQIFRDLYDRTRHEGDGSGTYFAASNLGCAAFALGDFVEAIALQRIALDLARSLGGDGWAALALGDLGVAEIAAGRHSDGIAHLEASIAGNRTIGRVAVLAHDLARIAGAQPDAIAATSAREALALVEADPERIALAPEILCRCAELFARIGDDASRNYCRAKGRAIVESRLATLETPSDRTAYASIRWNAALLEREPQAAPA